MEAVKVFEYKLSREKVYAFYFKLINGFLKLTDKEIEFASKLYYHKSLINSNIDKVANDILFSTISRKRLREELKVTQVVFNNYLKFLKEKNIVLVDENGFKYLNPKFEIDISKDNIGFLFRLKVEDGL
jgi:hypothetical protein